MTRRLGAFALLVLFAGLPACSSESLPAGGKKANEGDLRRQADEKRSGGTPATPQK